MHCARGDCRSGGVTTTVNDPALRPQRDGGLASGDSGANTLEEMCEFVADCPHFTPEWTDHGYLVIRNQNIRNGRLDLSNPSFTHKDDYDRRTKRAKPEPGDIIFTREAPMGEVCMLPKGVECCVGQRQVLLRPRKDVHGPYLLYVLQSPFVRRQIFWNEGTGSTVSNVRIPTLKALLIPRLGASERFAADCLRALDDKIELNRRMNETLEAMARALFKSWFVDFEPVRAKVAGRATGLPQSISTLFPSEMVQTKAQNIPIGWRTGTLADVAMARRHSVAPADCSDLTLYIGLEHMPQRSIALGSWGFAGGVKSAKSRFQRGDILFGKLRPYFHKVGIAPVDGVCSTDIVVIVSRLPEWPAFVSATVSSDGFVTYTHRTSTGTKMPRTSWNTMSRYAICIPPRELAAAYQEAVQPALDDIVANIHANITLASLRDALLPKLISGEIRATQAEKAVEAVTGSASA